jgi:hypothetical protein
MEISYTVLNVWIWDVELDEMQYGVLGNMDGMSLEWINDVHASRE